MIVFALGGIIIISLHFLYTVAGEASLVSRTNFCSPYQNSSRPSRVVSVMSLADDETE